MVGMKTIDKKHSLGNCPVAQASSLIGDTWVILIIRELLQEPKRFCELQNALIPHQGTKPINTRTLTQRLKTLEESEIINRKVFAHEMPPKVQYSLTKKGQALSKIVEQIRLYGKKYL